MSTPAPRSKAKSLADYLLRYDLAATIEEARADYSQSSSGGPRLLTQKDIAARFRKLRPAHKPPHE